VQRLKLPFIIVLLFSSLSCVSRVTPPSPLPPPVKKSEGLYHTVKKNETLWRICRTYRVSMQEVAELNNIKNTALIKVGDKIFIPGASQQLKVKSSQKDSEGITPGITMKKGMFIWPVKGQVITQFGINNGFKNDGIDIAVSTGSSVVASYDGQVVFSSDLKGYGRTIIIQHRDKYATVYANNKTNLVKKGDAVKTGQAIATAGGTGEGGSAPHLHFQIREHNQARNPLFYLP
jgi:murein DD-endopeptidase MepM/ murein hydrolase activator NlpD